MFYLQSVLSLTRVIPEAGAVELAHVEVQADDGEHEDGKEEQQANLQQRYHGFHDGLQHHLETWDTPEEIRF